MLTKCQTLCEHVYIWKFTSVIPLFDKLQDLLVGGVGEERPEMGEETVEGFFWGARAGAGGAAMKLLGRGKQRPAPAVFATMLVCWIDEILRDDTTGHLQTSDIAIEAAAHFRPVKTAGCSQLSGDERTLLLQGEQHGLFDGTL